MQISNTFYIFLNNRYKIWIPIRIRIKIFLIMHIKMYKKIILVFLALNSIHIYV